MDYIGYKTHIEGYRGPIYPKKAFDLNKILQNAFRLESFMLENALRKINGFEMIGLTGHSSGISWKKLSVVRGKKEIVVYLPLEFEKNATVTVYSAGADESEIDGITEEIISLIEEEKINAEKEQSEMNKFMSDYIKNPMKNIFSFFKKS